MKTLKWQLYIFISLLGAISSCDPEDIDYREKFCGNYKVTLYSSSYRLIDNVLTYTYDTIMTTAEVTKFEGYTCNNGENYLDVKHKIGILYSPDFTFNSNASSYNGTYYFTDGYLHPTIAETGILTYPEFTSDNHDEFRGSISIDSLKITFKYHGRGGGWSRELIGKRIN